MGSSLGSFLAKILFGFNEKLIFDRFPKPDIYLRYVYDTFASFCSRNEPFPFFQRLNYLHPSLTFTMDEEKHSKNAILGCIG